MLLEQTLERLRSLRLMGMAERLKTWAQTPAERDIGPTDLVALLADTEWTHRENRGLERRLRNARLRQNGACIEDITYGGERALTKAVIRPLASPRWVASHENVIVTGLTGVGKSYIACALGNRACRDGFTVLYRRTRRLFDELNIARADGSHSRMLRQLAKAQVLILDDFGTEALAGKERSDLLEIVEDRYGNASTILTSQRDPDQWHGVIGDETIADAVLDRLVHNAHRIKLGGPSIRKTKNGLTKEDGHAKAGN